MNKITCLLIAIAALGTTYSCQDSRDEYTVGAILSLSGQYSEYGQNVKKGIDLAYETFCDENPNVQVRLLYEDNKGNAKDAVNAYKKMSLNKPIAIIDGAISSLTLAIIPEITKDETVLISTGASSPQLSGISPFFFRLWNSDTEEGAFLAEKIINQYNTNNIGIIYLNTDYGLGLLNTFTAKYKDLGGSVGNVVAVDPNQLDFKDAVNKVNVNKVDAIYVIGYASETALLASQIRTINNHVKIFSTVATEANQLIELAGVSANGIIYPYTQTVSSTQYSIFKNIYLEKHNEDPQLLTDVGFDAMNLILSGITSNKVTKGKELQEHLATANEYNGASGKIKFDKNGDVHKEMTLKTIQNNKFIEIQK